MRRTFAAVLLAALLGLAGRAAAQDGGIRGRVLDAAGRPVAGARVTLLERRLATATDSAGRFDFPKVPGGTHTLEVAAVGRLPVALATEVVPGVVRDVEFHLAREAAALPEVVVDGSLPATAPRILTTFERRTVFGTGRYVTRADIERRNAVRLIDILRFVPGVRTACTEFGCQIRLNQDPRACPPAVFIDDFPTTAAALDATQPSEVLGIEIYRGPAETPPELNNEAARCGGAIVIWTRRGHRR